MKITEKLGLKKPDTTDTFDIETFNTNMDIIDNEAWQLAHPIGTYVITSTNTNPATIFGGGTWELRHKSFQRLHYYKNSETTISSDVVTVNDTNVSAVSTFLLEREGHTIRIRIRFTNKVAMLDTALNLFTVNLDKLGITGTGWTKYFTFFSDGGEGIIMAQASYAGAISSVDVTTNAGGGASIPAESSCLLDLEWTPVTSEMLNSACDEFHWLRTA